MNRISVGSVVLAVASLMLICTAPCRAARQAFIRVNGYYFVYTVPVVPYIDSHGVFMVGLEGMVRGWSFPDTHPSPDPVHPSITYGTVSYNLAARAATLHFGGHQLIFRAGSRLVAVDGHFVSMKSAAIWEPVSGQMIVPLAALTTALHLATSWDSVQHVLSVIGDGLTKNIDSSDYANLVGGEYGNAGWMVPEKACLRFGKPYGTIAISGNVLRPRPSPARFWLSLTVRNISGNDIADGADWINATSLYPNDAIGEYVDVELPPVAVKPSPPIRAGSTRTLFCQWTDGRAVIRRCV